MQGQVDVNNEKRTTIKMMKIVILTLVNYLPTESDIDDNFSKSEFYILLEMFNGMKMVSEVHSYSIFDFMT